MNKSSESDVNIDEYVFYVNANRDGSIFTI